MAMTVPFEEGMPLTYRGRPCVAIRIKSRGRMEWRLKVLDASRESHRGPSNRGEDGPPLVKRPPVRACGRTAGG